MARALRADSYTDVSDITGPRYLKLLTKVIQ